MPYGLEKRHPTHDEKKNITVEVVYIDEPAVPTAASRPSRYEHLDGLRGLAALLVVLHHYTPDFTVSLHEHGFGEAGNYWHLTSLPIVRLIWSGGNAAVAIFFILSGFALSIAPLQRMRKEGRPAGAEVRRGILGALIRRPARLYAPAIAITVLQAVLMHIPGLCVLNPNIPPVPAANLVAEMKSVVASKNFYNPLRDHEVEMNGSYNVALWTLPVELNGSLLVYGMSLLLSLGMVAGPGVRAPTALAISLFLGGLLVLQMTRFWSITCFLWGIMLAVLDTWPIGDYLRTAVRNLLRRRRTIRLEDVLPLFAEKTMKPRMSSFHDVTQKFVAKTPHCCLLIGLYILSIPGYPDHRYCADTPGYMWLNGLTPQPYDNDLRFHRYWTTIGALPVVYAVLRIRWLQTLFKTRTLLFLGRVSFALYLIHIPLKSIILERVKALLGGYTNAPLIGSFWDHYWNVSDVGPPGLSPRYLLSMGVILPCTLLVAYVATIVIDEPVVRMGKYITGKLGLHSRQKTNMKRYEDSKA